MRQPDEILMPRNLAEVLSILAEQPETARVVAGNTTMFEFVSRGLADNVKLLVDISGIGLEHIDEKEDGIHIGATTTLAELARSKVLLANPFHDLLAETAKAITPTQIRNVATIGGEICSAIPFFDLPVSLLALNATVTLRKKTGGRQLNLKDFFVDFITSAIEPGEVLTEVCLPKATNGSAGAFAKLGRTASDFAVVNAATSLQLNNSGVCTSARVWLGGVASTFRQCSASELQLIHSQLDHHTIMKASEAAADFDPTASIHASPLYKKKVIPVLVRECIQSTLRKLKP